MKKIILLLIISHFCNNVSAQITGNWQSPFGGGYTMKLELNADGSGKLDGAPITYKTASGKITILESGNVSNVYNYTVQGNKLQLSGGDLSAPINFTKESKGGLSEKINQQKNQTTESKTDNQVKISAGIVGTWTGATGKFIFNEDGTGTGNGSQMKYSLNGNNITMSDNTGTFTLNYAISGNILTMTGSGGSITFNRGDVNTTTPVNNNTGGRGQELVGKWCYLTSNYNSLYNSSNSSFTNECFTLKADGTYTYAYESNRSANGSGGFGYSNSSDSDQGTWSFDGGNKLTVNSAKSGTKVYTIEKRIILKIKIQ